MADLERGVLVRVLSPHLHAGETYAVCVDYGDWVLLQQDEVDGGPRLSVKHEQIEVLF